MSATAGKVALVAESIDAAKAFKTVDVSGLYVAPGFIDMHAHFWGVYASYVSIKDHEFDVVTAINTAKCLGATRWLLITDVLLPASLPAILGGLRTGLGVGWMSLIAAELVGAASAPPEDAPTEQDLAWFFKLFSLRGVIDGAEHMCFFTFMQKTDDSFD